MPETLYSYQDICLFPKYSPYRSRSEPGCSPATEFGGRGFKLPVLPANMACTIDTKLARWMSENDYFYIMHRFNVDHSHPVNQDNMAFLRIANEEKWKTISISVGVQSDDLDFLKLCVEKNLRIDYLTIDIAHAHSVRMKQMLQSIHELDFKAPFYRRDGAAIAWSNVPVKYRPFIIAGNVATPEAMLDLESWGADSVKVGIAAGKACRTFNETGFGVPMFSCILECSEVAKKPIISDGGISECGDFAKSLRAGATMVMAGSIFAACKDAPGENLFKNDPKGIWSDTITHKIYYGSASEHNKHSKHHIEGTKVELLCNGMTYEE